VIPVPSVSPFFHFSSTDSWTSVVRFQHKHYGSYFFVRLTSCLLNFMPVSLSMFFGFVVPTLLGRLWSDPIGAFVWGGLVSRLAS
jgi:stearoyl-CoA desaturase (delta-9 desaturase)